MMELETSIDSLPLAQQLLQRYLAVRKFSERIAAPLSAEDCAMQSMPDVSPTKWHLAHTTWFFETFILAQDDAYRLYNPAFESLFNSYYNSVGSPFPRHRRGQISRPSLAETFEYRHAIDASVSEFLSQEEIPMRILEVLELGLNHEQQHQELMLTDIKHVLFSHPDYPAYIDSSKLQILSPSPTSSDLQWHSRAGGMVVIGHSGASFCYDNELPQHRTYVQGHQLASRCVTNSEFRRFIADRGYQRPELWLSLGWNMVEQQRWRAPLYWVKKNGHWHQFTMTGLQPLNAEEPVCHVSYFEADAYARWAGKRLPTEFEWEASATKQLADPTHSANITGVFADRLMQLRCPVHPQMEIESREINLFGNLWEWTSSPYVPYPGFKTALGALGEYNGKFMCNQFVLRGGSCATPSDHIRPTYRNFFPPEARWQFTGIRLAE